MPEPTIEVVLRTQELCLTDATGVLRRFPVSTSKHGAGEKNGSLMTPRGRHRIRAKIGGGAAPGAVFVGPRGATGS